MCRASVCLATHQELQQLQHVRKTMQYSSDRDFISPTVFVALSPLQRCIARALAGT
jgi:hypothetical protein